MQAAEAAMDVAVLEAKLRPAAQRGTAKGSAALQDGLPQVQGGGGSPLQRGRTLLARAQALLAGASTEDLHGEPNWCAAGMKSGFPDIQFTSSFLTTNKAYELCLTEVEEAQQLSKPSVRLLWL